MRNVAVHGEQVNPVFVPPFSDILSSPGGKSAKIGQLRRCGSACTRPDIRSRPGTSTILLGDTLPSPPGGRVDAKLRGANSVMGHHHPSSGANETLPIRGKSVATRGHAANALRRARKLPIRQSETSEASEEREISTVNAAPLERGADRAGAGKRMK
jgi:hypothetical protein